MTPYRKDGKPGWMITIATRAGGYVQRGAGTQDKATAKAIEQMFKGLGKRGARMWELVDAVVAKRLHPAVLYDHYLRGTLDTLHAHLNDADLRPGLAAWETRITDTLAPETSRHYVQQVAKLFPGDAPVWRSTVTAPWLKAQLATIKGSNTNRRRYGAAWVSALEDLAEQGFFTGNPMRAVSLPPSNKAKERHIGWPDALRLIGLMEGGQHRALCALRHGAGIEASAALRTYRRDVVDPENRVVWAHGTKNTHRDRQAVHAADCWAIFWGWAKAQGFLPDAPLFTCTAREHQAAQDVAYALLRAQRPQLSARYLLHDCRHTYAVHGMEEGWEPTLIAANEGHANANLVLTRYGKYRPTVTQLIRSARKAESQAK